MTAPALVRVVEREARAFRKMWRGTAFSGVLSPLFFLTAIGIELGDIVDARTRSVGGLDYLEFVTPALLAASAMQIGAGQMWGVMAGVKWVRSYHGIVATPLGPSEVFGGEVVWNSLRTALYATAFFVPAALLGGVPSVWGIVAIPAAVLTGAAFAAPLMAFAATRETDASFAAILRLVIAPLFLFSGTFFPIDLLPGWLEALAVLSPLWHGVELCRDATTGTFSLGPDVVHVAALLACVAAGWAWGSRTFARKLTP